MMSMTDLSFRQLFKPIQPAVKSNNEQIGYLELLPAISLSNYIYCYWRLKSAHKLSTAFSYRVIPDGCIDIFFNMNDPQDSRVMGFSTILVTAHRYVREETMSVYGLCHQLFQHCLMSMHLK
jgi:hypothetical protein